MRLSIRCLAALVIALLIPALAAAQTEFGKVTGTVTDQSGAVLPGVTVNLKSVERASVRSTVTNAQGEYVFASLVPGNYEVTAELSGFSTKQTRTNVSVGATVNVNVQMAVGAQTEVITVVGETAAQINTSTQDIATTVNETQIRELPTITRNPYDLVALSGQASRDTESDRGTGYAINGAALGEHEHPARRLGEQRRLHGHGRPGRCPSTPCRSSRSSPRTSRPSTAAPPAGSSTWPPSPGPTSSTARSTSSSATTPSPRTPSTTRRTASSRASSTATRRASASAAPS